MAYKNKEDAILYKHRYYYANKDKIRENYYNNRDDILRKEKERYRQNRVKKLIYASEYKKRNRDKVNAYKERRKDYIKAKQKEYYIESKTVDIICMNCGKPGKSTPYNPGKFCSVVCKLTWLRGANCSTWKGGISYEPYCPKFNNDLKRRVRDFFDNECVVCGKSTKDNKKNLSVHHVEYDKQACCDGLPVQFVALCGSCHCRTNNNRDRWENMFHVIIDEMYNGRSYYTKEEYKSIRSDRCVK